MVVGDREVARMMVGAKAENQRKGASVSCPSYPTKRPIIYCSKEFSKISIFHSCCNISHHI